jgi:hypothetical protein
MCLAFSPADGETYVGLNWTDSTGNLYAAASWEASDAWVEGASQPLVRPAWDVDEIIDMVAAERAQAALAWLQRQPQLREGLTLVEVLERAPLLLELDAERLDSCMRFLARLQQPLKLGNGSPQPSMLESLSFLWDSSWQQAEQQLDLQGGFQQQQQQQQQSEGAAASASGSVSFG